MNHWIHDIEINNFKSIRHQKIEGCKKINVFVGPPNVGKSNLLEAMALLSYLDPYETSQQSLHDKLRFDNVSELFFNFKQHIELSSNNKIEFKIGYIDSDYVEYDLKIADNFSKHNVVDIDNFGFNYEKIIEARTEVNEQQAKYKIFHDTLVKYYKFDWNNRNSKKIRGLQLIQPNGSNLGEVIFENEYLSKIAKQLINDDIKTLKFYNGTELKIEVKGKEYKTDKLLPFSSVSDTLQRLLFQSAAVLSNSNSVILLEEPEANMYPPYISKLTWEIMDDKNNNQFFMATHSPYVINDFLENKQDDLAIYVVGYKDGETIIRNALTKEEMDYAYQFGYDFFMNLENFMP